MPDPWPSRSRDDRLRDGQEVKEVADGVPSMQRRSSAYLAPLCGCKAYGGSLELSKRSKSADGIVTGLSRQTNYQMKARQWLSWQTRRLQ